MKKFAIYILLVITVLSLFGCKKKQKNIDENNNTNTEASTATPQPKETATPALEKNKEGQVRSSLTGLWVDEAIAKKRPYAIVFNNISVAAPFQSGNSQADIMYEAIVEGGITRLLGIGQNYTGNRIGSTRSARHYFVSIASEYDAIYVHFGKTKYATSKFNELHMDHLDGTAGIGSVVFYRDNSIRPPHNAFSSVNGIRAGIKKMGFRTELKNDYNFNHFKFYEKDTDLTSNSTANKVSIKFSGCAMPYFEYNSKDKLYYRFQFGRPHKDAATGKQLTFKNIIVQYVKEWNIDRKGYQTMDLANASGRGIYISNGKMVPITWKKKEATGFMCYYNEAGEELSINPGKSYIALFPNNRTNDVVVN